MFCKGNARQYYNLYGKAIRNFSLNVLIELKTSYRAGFSESKHSGQDGAGRGRGSMTHSPNNLGSEHEEGIFENLKA